MKITKEEPITDQATPDLPTSNLVGSKNIFLSRNLTRLISIRTDLEKELILKVCKCKTIKTKIIKENGQKEHALTLLGHFRKFVEQELSQKS
jgi:hypothetical protein